jgi:phosphatidylglycerophosphate synthase
VSFAAQGKSCSGVPAARVPARWGGPERRPLASRDLNIAQRAAGWLIDRRVPANAISLASIGCAALAAIGLAATSWTDGVLTRVLFLTSAGFVQARLLANLLDGMVAIGSGTASSTGELFNEVPDRIADALILIGAGFSAGGSPTLGYAAALLAMFTAYVRALGNSVGATGLFIGPMAKPHRMAAITAACACTAFAPGRWMTLALAVIVVGAVVTASRRLHRIAAQLGPFSSGESRPISRETEDMRTALGGAR